MQREELKIRRKYPEESVSVFNAGLFSSHIRALVATAAVMLPVGVADERKWISDLMLPDIELVIADVKEEPDPPPPPPHPQTTRIQIVHTAVIIGVNHLNACGSKFFITVVFSE
jgi:hypothetical protein